MRKQLLVLPLAVVVTAVVTWLASLYVLERPVFGDRVEQHTMQSSALGEQRGFLVHLPESYSTATGARYPVIYVLDGSSQDIHTAESAALLARIGLMPEVIVVGIPNTSGEGRQRDYTPPDMRQDTDPGNPATGGADRFLAFIRDELIPHVEARYRTAPGRMLAGHSRGGLFVTYAFISEPGLFDAYMAHSPALWRDEHRMVRHLQRILAGNVSADSTLFLSLGSEENEKMRRAYDEAVTVLANSAPPQLKWRAYTSQGGGHSRNPRMATPVALHWLYSNQAAETLAAEVSR